MGVHRKIKTPEEFDKLANEYFSRCEISGEPVTITGLVLAVGYNSKSTFYEQAKRPEFEDVVKKSRLRVEHEYEKRLCSASNAAGPIFALKNFDWSDKQSIEHSGKVSAEVNIYRIPDNGRD